MPAKSSLYIFLFSIPYQHTDHAYIIFLPPLFAMARTKPTKARPDNNRHNKTQKINPPACVTVCAPVFFFLVSVLLPLGVWSFAAI
jgi:hypothetical protein